MAAEPEPLRNQRNYRITEADRIGAGSLKRKCQDNLAAIELLKRLEAEGREPTRRREAGAGPVRRLGRVAAGLRRVE